MTELIRRDQTIGRFELIFGLDDLMNIIDTESNKHIVIDADTFCTLAELFSINSQIDGLEDYEIEDILSEMAIGDQHWKS